MKKTPQRGDAARIQLARTSGTGEIDEIQLNLISGDTHVRLAMTLLNFAELMSGSAHVEAKVVRWETRVIPPFKSTRTEVTK